MTLSSQLRNEHWHKLRLEGVDLGPSRLSLYYLQKRVLEA